MLFIRYAISSPANDKEKSECVLMRLVSTTSCPEGSKLAKPIFNEQGLVLLGEHVELTLAILRRLDQYGISHVYIHDGRTDDIVVEDAISEETRKRAVQEIRSNFKQLMDQKGKQHGLNVVRLGKQFKDLVNLIVDDLGRNPQAMLMLTDMSVKDHYLFQHSLNVCLYSTILGMAHGYTKDELGVLSLGALLHDIGKTQVPDNVLLKPGRLNLEEFDIIKRHTVDGFKLLKDIPNVPLLSAHCALQHHERLDGSGYPRGIAGAEIHDYAQWIGLADTYDAMTTNRVYRRSMLPHEAMETIYSGAGVLFDQKKIEVFRDRVAIYPIGQSIMLNTGEMGVVVDLNGAYAHRPIVRVLRDASGQDLKDTYEVDLSKKLTVLISGVEA